MITVVLDDDPTGTQAAAGISVVLDWSDPDVWTAVAEDDRGVHVLTNSRAYDAAAAGAVVASAALAARAAFPRCRLVLRGDSTLRGHLWEEYEAVRSVTAPDREDVPLLLVPALPAAGRITLDGVHLIEYDGRRLPLDRTEYARDGDFAYSTSDLARWAEERSRGRLAAADAIRVSLEHIRAPGGAAVVAEAIAAAGALGRPGVVVPDAETDTDLRTIADGYLVAQAGGIPVVVRSSPAFAAIMTGSAAPRAVESPGGENGLLVVCGSYVANSTAQVERLAEAHPGAIVEASIASLAAAGWAAEVARLAATARWVIAREGLAVVVTDRQRDPAVAASGQRQIARALGEVARRVGAGLVIAKGGITSAITARDGLGARSARVVGPIVPGVSLWRLDSGRSFVVVPGNVGGPELLVDLVRLVGQGAPAVVETC